MFTNKTESSLLTLKELRMMFMYALAFFVFFYFFYGLSSLLVDESSNRFHVAFQWEEHIPFIPHAAWIYNSLSTLLVVSLFILRDKKRIHLFFKILCYQIVIASVFFLVFPIEKTFPPRYEHVDLPWVFLLADTINLKNNDFPSLHVCLAFTASIISAFYIQEKFRILLYAWAFLIAVSTMLIHEHHLIDVIGGILLSGPGIMYFVKIADDLGEGKK